LKSSPLASFDAETLKLGIEPCPSVYGGAASSIGISVAS
jgi:hypothetical protein